MAKNKKLKKSFRFRAKLPIILRGFAIFGFVVAIFAIGIGFYKASNKTTFRMKGELAQLSKEVLAVVNDYERKESEDGVLKYFIKADKATTFTDKHQELENVYLEVYQDGSSESFHKLESKKAIYIPAEDGTKNFRIYLAGDVDIKTNDGLEVKTDQLKYDQSTEVAEGEEQITFSRQNISGKSFGAIVNIKNETLDLLKDVEIDAYASDNKNILSGSGVRRAKLKSGRAFIEKLTEKIKLEQGAEIYLTPEGNGNENLTQPTDIKANQAIAFFKDQEIRKIDLRGNVDVYQKPFGSNNNWTKTKAGRAIAGVDKELKKLELYDNVIIETTANTKQPTKITSNTAIYVKETDIFELNENVEIITVQDSKPTKINASQVIYEQTNGKVFLTGNSQVTQGTDLVKGNTINAELYSNKKLKLAYASGNAFLRQDTTERKTEVSATEINATFDQNQKLQKANALGNSDVKVFPKTTNEYSRLGLFAPKEINLDFRSDGTLSNLRTQGRTTIKLNAVNKSEDSANKKLTANSINTTLRANGTELATAQAKGNAELLIEPLRSSNQNYRTTIKASQFNCDFYSGNNAKSCETSGRTKAYRYPTVKKKSNQMLESNKMKALFNKKDQDIERFDAIGKAKFQEGDRNGISDRIIYTENNGLVRLSGGNPTVWDSQARAKASEILWDTKADKSELRNRVSTTYYSQKQTNGSTPFTNVSSPVFITAQKANFDHKAETAVYVGNARAWQGNNYVRAERLLLQQKEGQMFAEGKVQSMLYDVKQTIAGRKTRKSVFAAADKMLFQRNLNLLRYEKNVDIRQGTDRIVAGVANVFLDKNNELSKTIISKNVVITQPNRRATGDYAQYTASDESVVLRGNPAKVIDSENGSSQGKEVIVYLKENRIIGKGSNKKNKPGRIRTVYKIKNGSIN